MPTDCYLLAFFILSKMNHFENYIALKEQALRVTNILNKINPLEYPWEVNDYHAIDVFIEHSCMDTNVIVIRNYDEINDCQPKGNYGQDSIMFPDQFLYDNEITIQTKIKTKKLWKY
jgi:hypothetical protein